MPITNLHGKRCLVTGAASGIGRATALAAAAQGAQLFLTDIDAPALERTAEAIRAAGGSVALARSADVADVDAVRDLAAAVHALGGSLDVVMNVAGIAIWGTVERLRHEDWRRCVEVNLMGPIHVIECFVPAMVRAGRGGHLVNVSSAAGLFGLPWHAPYSASKFGLRGISEVLRFDLARHGIGVSLVCPGAVDTGLVGTVKIQGVDPADPRVRALKQRFQKHAIKPEAAAHAILRGVCANRYLVFTSADIRLGHWLQRFFPWPYEWAMRRLGRELQAVAQPASPEVDR